ncbi:MAG: tRNA preQ1(34) S-adenosylmethionine ribosyltransferase-isomerase QueA [Halioglobus sp.]|nr:tRNA preQ1(34) S-adenosylmethionine ribosyltransferase-isomerase QueA [Halioglobus sp.]
MKRSDFSYQLPSDRIAQYPLPNRDASRLMVLQRGAHKREHYQFYELPGLLRPEDVLVFNDTRVIPARLWGRKDTGGKVEILVERVTGTHECLAHIRASKSPTTGATLNVRSGPGAQSGDYQLQVLGREGELFCVSSAQDVPLADILSAHGHMPLPPYVERSDEALDRERYQTVYARCEGAVAAPTAGLHFSDKLLAKIDERGIRRVAVTLHVGAGTFQPVREEHIEQHVMHKEYAEINETVCEAVRDARERGGRVIAVGTTAVRSLETASLASGGIQPYCGDTDIFIYPGHRFRSVDAIITNFHLPESTLLMLVSAFAGRAPILAAYEEAIASGYRFFSYGDAMLLTVGPPPWEAQ